MNKAKGFFVFALAVAVFTTIIPPPIVAPAAQSAHPDYAAINSVWQSADANVGQGANHSWVWGPEPFFTTYEPAATASANHLVEYFDKGRLEVNDPAADPTATWYVSSGTLVQEMISGKIATANGYEARTASQATVFSGGPRYADFALLTSPFPDRTGLPLRQQLLPGGKTQNLDAAALPTASYAYFDATSGHNIASLIWERIAANDPLFTPNWLYILGRPISEPYWVSLSQGGKQTMVLLQMFERRALTYNPANADPFKLEYANVGRDYYEWRYNDPRAYEEKPPADYTNYNVGVQISAANQVQVKETITYINSTANPLPTIVLRVSHPHRRDQLTISVSGAGGKLLTSEWRSDINLEVVLPTPLKPRQATTLNVDFQFVAPEVGGTFGYDQPSDVLTLGDWLPTVLPYDNGGWLIYPPTNAGDESVSVTANYVVTYSADRPIVVAATGKPQQLGDRLWRYTAPSVRDIAATISPRLSNPLADRTLQRQVGGTTIYGFFVPEHMPGGRPALDIAAAAFAWNTATFGPYPFDTYIITEVAEDAASCGTTAQEYPMIAMLNARPLINPPRPANPTTWLTQHEVSHAWFYSTVGNDQLRDPWLDEGLTTMANLEYLRATDEIDYVAAFDSMTTDLQPESVNATVFDFPNAGACGIDNAYFLAVYSQSATFLNEVRRAMGTDNFDAALSDYYMGLRLQRAHARDLLVALQRRSSTDLSPIFDKFLSVY